jgi:hypothetical protein
MDWHKVVMTCATHDPNAAFAGPLARKKPAL